MADDESVTGASSADAAKAAPAEATTYDEIAGLFGDENNEKPAEEAKPLEPEKKDEVTQPIADEDHPTKLGRKVKDLTEKFDTLMSKFDEFVSTQKPTADSTGDVVDKYSGNLYEQMCAIEPPPVDTIVTAQDLIATQNWERRVMAKIQAQEQVNYEKGYIRKAKELKDEGGELHEQILAMITDPKDDKFNRRIKNIPDVDAELNYRRAQAALISGRSVKETFGKGDSPAGTGVTQPTTKEVKVATKVELDPIAADYARHVGMSADDIQRALSR